MLDHISEYVVNLMPEEVDRGVKVALDRCIPAPEILAALRKGSEELGSRFERGEYFVSDLVILGQILREALEDLKPHLKAVGGAEGVVVIGTILGDIHNIGKDVVSPLLISSGFKVHDLGVDVPGDVFVSKALEVKADVIGASVLYSGASLNLKELAQELSKRGLSGKVKVIVGGVAAQPQLVSEFGVERVVNDAVEGVNIIRRWLSSGGVGR